MGSKNVRMVFALALVSSSIACTRSQHTEGEYLIGDKLEAVALASRDGSSQSKVAMFDQVTRRIHVFKTSSLEHERAYEVTRPEAQHFVLQPKDGRYVVDLSTKNLSVYDGEGKPSHDLLHLAGSPVSAAYRPEAGWIVVYDSMMTVGVVKITDEGKVSAAWTGGSLVQPGSSIVAGDILPSGKLALSLSDDSVALVDLTASIAQLKWQLEKFASPVGRITWLAPVPNTSLALVKTETKIALLDLAARTLVAERPLGSGEVVKLVKSGDPHVLLRTGRELALVYVKDGLLRESANFPEVAGIVSSRLNLELDHWTLIESSQEITRIDDDVNAQKRSRTLKRYRFSDMAGYQNMALPPDAELEVTNDFVFALYPSKLGYAKKIRIQDETVEELKLFNLPYIQ